MSTPVESLCRSYPTEFGTYLNYCRSLKFADKPDYSYLRKMFKDLFFREGYAYDHSFDWTPNSTTRADLRLPPRGAATAPAHRVMGRRDRAAAPQPRRVGAARCGRTEFEFKFSPPNVVELHLVDLQLRRRRLSGSVRRRAARRQQRHAQPAKTKATEHALDLREKVVRRALAAEGCEWRARRRRVGLSALDANLFGSAAGTMPEFPAQLLAFPRAVFVGVATRLDGGADGAAVVVVAPHRAQLTRRGRARQPREAGRRAVVFGSLHIHTSLLSGNARAARPPLRLRGSRRRRRCLPDRRLRGSLLRHGRRLVRVHIPSHTRTARAFWSGQVCGDDGPAAADDGGRGGDGGGGDGAATAAATAAATDGGDGGGGAGGGGDGGGGDGGRKVPSNALPSALRPTAPVMPSSFHDPPSACTSRHASVCAARQKLVAQRQQHVRAAAERRHRHAEDRDRRARRFARRPRRRLRWPCPPPRPPPRRLRLLGLGAPRAATSCARSGRSSACVRKLRDGDRATAVSASRRGWKKDSARVARTPQSLKAAWTAPSSAAQLCEIRC